MRPERPKLARGRIRSPGFDPLLDTRKLAAFGFLQDASELRREPNAPPLHEEMSRSLAFQ